MNKRTLMSGLSILAAFILGRYVLPSPASGFTGVSPIHLERVRAWEEAGLDESSLKPGHSMRRRLDRLQTPSDGIAGALYRDLHTGDPVELHQRVTDHLARMDQKNWQDILAQFSAITQTSGRVHDEFWTTILTRIGQVAGEDAMRHFLSHGAVHDHVLYGWAMSDPNAAWSWLAETSEIDDGTRGRLIPLLSGGIALNHPALAKEFLASLSESDQLHCAGHMVWNMIRGHGLNGANQWLDELLEHQPSTALVGRVFDETLRHAIRMNVGEDPRDQVIDWFRRYGNTELLTLQHVSAAVGQYQNKVALDGFEFLQGILDLPVMTGHQENPPALSALVRKAYQANSSGLESWLGSNTSAPFWNRAVESYTELLEQRGDTAQAEQWRSRLER